MHYAFENPPTCVNGFSFGLWVQFRYHFDAREKRQKRSSPDTRLRVEALDCDGCSKKNNAKTLDFLIFVGEADTELITYYILLLTSQKSRKKFLDEVRVKR